MNTRITHVLAMIAVFACILFTASCKKKSTGTPAPVVTCTSCVTTPDAVAAYDNSSKGIYKGTVVGSSGTIKFNIGNNDSTITATMVINDTTVALTASVSWTSGVAYVSPFTGTLGGAAVSITFSVGADGTNPTVTAASIPGHPNAVLNVTKETSTNLIMVFEGTYADNSSSGDRGTFDLFLSKVLKKWTITSKSSVDPTKSSDNINGTFDNNTNTLSYTDGSGGVITGTLSGDKITGTYNGGGNSGTFTATRTL